MTLNTRRRFQSMFCGELIEQGFHFVKELIESVDVFFEGLRT